jgi:hypothetical protein
MTPLRWSVHHHRFIVAQYRNFEDFGDGFYSAASRARDIAEALIDMRNHAAADDIKALGLTTGPTTVHFLVLFVRTTS